MPAPDPKTVMPAQTALCQTLRAQGAAEGSLFGVFLDAELNHMLTTAVAEGTAHVDELFLQHLVGIVADLAMAAVIFAVVRREGRPARIDKRLWRELRLRLEADDTDCLDLIIVGATRQWSLASGRSIPVADRP